jgi:hypothetical protein
MAKLPIDDIVKAVLKQIGGKKNQKVRYDFAKQTGTLGKKNPSSKVTGKKATERARAATPKSSSGAKQSRRKGTSTTGRPVGRIAQTKPERKRRDFVSTKNTGITTNDSQRRAANREGNKFLRMNSEGAKANKSTSKDMPVDVKGSIIKPPSKATMRPAKPSRESYESDQLLRDLLTDLRGGRGGSKAPKKKNVVTKTPKGTMPNVKKAPAKPTSKANTSQSSSRPRGGTKPMTPAQKRAKEKKVQERAKTRDELKQRQPKKNTKDRYYNTDK